jgi:hypothetical protein
MIDDQFDPSTEDPELRLHLSCLPRHDAPPELMAKLRRKYTGPTWKQSLQEWFAWPMVWKPAGLVAAAALMGVLWFSYQKKDKDDAIDIGPLLAAHSVTQAQGLVPDSDMTATDFSAQLASYYANN